MIIIALYKLLLYINLYKFVYTNTYVYEYIYINDKSK